MRHVLDFLNACLLRPHCKLPRVIARAIMHVLTDAVAISLIFLLASTLAIFPLRQAFAYLGGAGIAKLAAFRSVSSDDSWGGNIILNGLQPTVIMTTPFGTGKSPSGPSGSDASSLCQWTPKNCGPRGGPKSSSNSLTSSDAACPTSDNCGSGSTIVPDGVINGSSIVYTRTPSSIIPIAPPDAQIGLHFANRCNNKKMSLASFCASKSGTQSMRASIPLNFSRLASLSALVEPISNPNRRRRGRNADWSFRFSDLSCSVSFTACLARSFAAAWAVSPATLAFLPKWISPQTPMTIMASDISVEAHSISGFSTKMAKSNSTARPASKRYPNRSERLVCNSYRSVESGLIACGMGYIRPFGRRRFGKHAFVQEIIAAILVIMAISGLLWRLAK